MNIDELDFWIAGACMFGYDNWMDRDEFATDIYYKFRRLFTKELIRQRIDLHYEDPQRFYERVAYLRDKKIAYPWNHTAKVTLDDNTTRPEVGVAEEFLLEINNLIHFQEPLKVQSLLSLARGHFTVNYDSYDSSISYLESDVVKRVFLMVATTNHYAGEKWFGLFVGEPNHARAVIKTINEKSWWYEEEPEVGKIWVHAPYHIAPPDSIIEQMRERQITFLALLVGQHKIQITTTQPELLRHKGRIATRPRPNGWYLQVLEEMERCGSRNAKYALQSAFR